MIYIKHKRSITAIILIFIGMLFISADKKMSTIDHLVIKQETVKESLNLEEEIRYVSMELGKDYVGGYTVSYNDEIEELFDKFEVPFIYRDFTRLICELQNVDPLIFISLIQIESHWGTSFNGVTSDYNNIVDYRMYGSEKQWTDLGLGQLSTRYEKDFRERYFNPALLLSLGYIRTEFKITDPWCNLQVSAAYLGFLYRYFGNYELAVQSYNTGLGNVIKGNIPNITKQYTHAILNFWRYRERDI